MRKAIKSIVGTISIPVVSRKNAHGVELVILRHSSEHDDLVVAGKTHVTTIYLDPMPPPRPSSVWDRLLHVLIVPGDHCVASVEQWGVSGPSRRRK